MKKETLFEAAVVLGFVVLLLRLFSIQVRHGAEYEQMALRNHFRYIPIPAPRGTIWSAEGTTLASNHTATDLVVYREEMGDAEALKRRLCALLPYRRDEVLARWRQMEYTPAYIPHTVLSDLEETEVPMIELEKVRFPELALVKPMRRIYPYAELFSHALGYIAELSPEDQGAAGGRPGDWVGKAGLERSYDERLRGADGQWAVVVDSREREVARYLERRAQDGTPLRTGLRLALHQAARDAFGEDSGAAVVMDVRTGEVLCYYSSPGYPTVPPTSSLAQAVWKRVFADPRKPMLDRVSQGTYPPGSLFKVILASAALEEGIWGPSRTVHCGGAFQFGNKAFRCWNRGGHGAVDMRRALMVSCDVYFYQLGLALGVDRINAWGRRFGMDVRTGVDIPFEKTGLIPSEEWSQRVRKVPWYPGETVSLAIGQGPVLVTAMKACQVYAAIANGGELLAPRLAPDGEPRRQRVEIAPSTLAFLRSALGDVVAVAGGTAHGIDGIPTIAGKTGTSQVMSEVAGQPYIKEHAWFAGFAPRENPRVACAVLVEHGGHGSSAAAPLAATLLREALK
jgi:penicillin-binding protein 2